MATIKEITRQADGHLYCNLCGNKIKYYRGHQHTLCDDQYQVQFGKGGQALNTFADHSRWDWTTYITEYDSMGAFVRDRKIPGLWAIDETNVIQAIVGGIDRPAKSIFPSKEVLISALTILAAPHEKRLAANKKTPGALTIQDMIQISNAISTYDYFKHDVLGG